jgi:dehydrogenase/reductase SDR family protein 7B
MAQSCRGRRPREDALGEFQDKVFLVTGASSGIGREIARALWARGARVVAMARTTDTLEALCAESGAGDRALAFSGDVTVEADCRAAVAAAIARFGALDGLVHAAGLSMRGRAADTDMAVFRRLMEVNYFATIALAQAALPALRARRGHLVAISSVVGYVSPPHRSGYAASKHAVQGFIDSLRVEEAATGLHVLSVCSGWARTNMSINALEPDGRPHGSTDETTAKGLDPAVVARAVMGAISGRKREIYPAGLTEKLALALNRWAPPLLDHLLARRAART